MWGSGDCWAWLSMLRSDDKVICMHLDVGVLGVLCLVMSIKVIEAWLKVVIDLGGSGSCMVIGGRCMSLWLPCLEVQSIVRL